MRRFCTGYKGAKPAYAVQTEIPYDFVRKRLTIQVKSGKDNFAITKGALSIILNVCSQVETSDGKISNIAARKEA